MTPYEIKLLVHHYCTEDPYPQHSEILSDTLRIFIDNGLIEQVIPEDHYKITDRGMAHIDQLCNISWPTQVWVDERGRPVTRDQPIAKINQKA